MHQAQENLIAYELTIPDALKDSYPLTARILL